MEDSDMEALSCPPRTTALWYMKVKAYGNHFRVNECNTKGMVTFDYGLLTSIFGQQQAHMGDGDTMVEYVGFIKDIFKMDYRPISTPIILMQCAWVKTRNDVWGNPTHR